MDRPTARRFLITFLLAAALWWVLTGGASGSWVIGLPAALAAAAASLLQPPPRRQGIRLAGALRFAPYYLLQSLRGGVDVARRALSPSLPLAPGFVRHTTRLPRGPSRTFFMGVVSLLPGTLSVRMEGDGLIVHVLDTALPTAAALARLESRVADLFESPGAGDAA